MTFTDSRVAVLIVAVLVGTAVATGAAVAGASSGDVTVQNSQVMQDDGDDGDSDDAGEAYFQIVDVETNTPITAGEELVTTVEVENTGGESGESDVWFYLGEHHKDTITIQLDAGESTTVELTYVSKRGDDGEWTHTTGTDDDTSERTIYIEEASSSDSSGSSGSSGSSDGYTWASPDDDEGVATFEITDVQTNDPIDERETLNVSVTVENTGDAEANKRVWALLDGDRIVAETVSLEAGESAVINGSYETGLGDAELSNLTVGTPDDSVEQTVEIRALESDFVLSEVDAPWSIEGGETVEVTAVVTNQGDRNGTDRVTLALGENTIDGETLHLDVGESETVTLTYESAVSAAGSWDLTVATADDQRGLTLMVTEPDEPTPTETESSDDADDAADAADDADDTEDEEGSFADADGFGVAVALVAVLGTALLASRRLSG